MDLTKYIQNEILATYTQYEVLRCAAKIRPEYCEFAGNVCCFSCKKNDECTQKALTENLKIKPCRPVIPIRVADGKFKKVVLFDEFEKCEFSI